MIANDLTLNPGAYGGISANKIFVSGGQPTPTSVIRRVQATALSAPESLLISHQFGQQRGSIVYDRHLVRHDLVLIDPLKGSVKGSTWTAIEVPRGTSVFTNSVMKDMNGRVIHCLLTAGVYDALLAGES